MSLQWGDVPAWVEAIATVAAFGAVAFPLWQANADRRQAQASTVDYLVFAYPFEDLNRHGPPKQPDLAVKAAGWDDVWVSILNNSANAIHEVTLDLPFWGLAMLNVRLGKVLPGMHLVRLLDVTGNPPAEAGPAMPRTALEHVVESISFRDRANRVWGRTADGRLTRLSNRASEKQDRRQRQINSPAA
jgi:hypothetical protein